MVLGHPEFDGHQRVVFCHDRETGLRAIIAVHDTRLGPALGGCRMWPYGSEDEALGDVLRLSRAMTMKAALAGLSCGGGKSVIIGDSRRDKTPGLIAAFARCVDDLGGLYAMAEDVGITVADIDLAGRVTRHVAGASSGFGDPSPATARGVFAGIQAALRSRFGQRATLAGARVAVQGLGQVGYNLCRLLHAAGARLTASDLDREATARAVVEFGATAVPPEAIVGVRADVFAPCALGGAIDDAAVERLRAPIVAGSANNQLSRPRHGAALHARGILYAPDYVINAGGLILVATEAGGGGRDAALARIDGIAATLRDIFARSARTSTPTSQVADAMALEVLERHSPSRQVSAA